MVPFFDNSSAMVAVEEKRERVEMTKQDTLSSELHYWFHHSVSQKGGLASQLRALPVELAHIYLNLAMLLALCPWTIYFSFSKIESICS